VGCKGFGKKLSLLNFKVLFWHSPGGTKENHKKPQDIPSPDRYWSPEPPEYEAGVNKLTFYEAS
jgi:hypothetical protein